MKLLITLVGLIGLSMIVVGIKMMIVGKGLIHETDFFREVKYLNINKSAVQSNELYKHT